MGAVWPLFCWKLPKFAWLDSGITFKCPAEIKSVLIPHQFSHHLDFHIGISKQEPLGFVHP